MPGKLCRGAFPEKAGSGSPLAPDNFTELAKEARCETGQALSGEHSMAHQSDDTPGSHRPTWKEVPLWVWV